MAFSVWGISYSSARSLMRDLAANEIATNVTAGGIEIRPDGKQQIDVMNRICGQHNIVATHGLTPHQESVMYPQDDQEETDDMPRLEMSGFFREGD